MDRKRETILTRITQAQRDLEGLKSTQFAGADTTEILIGKSNLGYDIDFELLNNERAYVTVNYNPDALKDWQDTTYDQIGANVYINNPGDPTADLYHGEFVNVLPTQDLSAYVAQKELQIVNVSGVTKHIYIKGYCLTTALSGTLNTSYFI